MFLAEGFRYASLPHKKYSVQISRYFVKRIILLIGYGDLRYYRDPLCRMEKTPESAGYYLSTLLFHPCIAGLDVFHESEGKKGRRKRREKD